MTDDLTVSLTTTSRRIANVHAVIACLLRQTHPFRRLVLWVSSEPWLLDRGIARDAVPARLRALCDERFSIEWTPNLGPHRKLVPALARYGGTIVTADDDTLYPRDWLAGLVAMRAESPGAICCYRARTMPAPGEPRTAYVRWPRYLTGVASHTCFPTGKDGVLYPPHALHPDVLDTEALLALAPTNDDIWFKAMALRQGTPARAAPHHRGFPSLRLTALGGLFLRRNFAGNDTMLERVFRAYGLADGAPDTVRTP